MQILIGSVRSWSAFPDPKEARGLWKAQRQTLRAETVRMLRLVFRIKQVNYF